MQINIAVDGEYLPWRFQVIITDKSESSGFSVYITLLQIRSILLEPGLPCPAMLLFNHPVRGIIPIINMLPINSNNNEDHCKALLKRKMKNDKNHDTSRNYTSISIIYFISSVRRWWNMVPYHSNRKRRSLSQQQIFHNMHNKDRMTYHKKKQACKDNTDHSLTIPTGPVNKHIRPDTVEDILAQFENQTEHSTHSQWTGKHCSNWEQ